MIVTDACPLPVTWITTPFGAAVGGVIVAGEDVDVGVVALVPE